MKKQEVYVNLQGKTKSELTDLWEFLTKNNEPIYRTKERFLEYDDYYLAFNGNWQQMKRIDDETEVTIEQLKQIIKPMATFTPIAMKCTQEQFNTVKPKLKGFYFSDQKYFYNSLLTNNVQGNLNYIGFVISDSDFMKERKVYEEWNEEIFLKACGIEVNTLEQQLQQSKSEVERIEKLIEEENKPKINDWVYIDNTKCFFKVSDRDINYLDNRHTKITNKELIKLLEQEIK